MKTLCIAIVCAVVAAILLAPLALYIMRGLATVRGLLG
jgi:hypothetical protein